MNSVTFSCTSGIRLCPPTKISSTWCLVVPASPKMRSQVATVRSTIAREAFEGLPSELHVHVEGLSVVPFGDVGDVDLRLGARRQLDLGGLRGVPDALDGDPVPGEVYAVLVQELLEDVPHEAVIEVHAAEEGVAAGRDDLEDPVLDVDDGDVEGPAAEVVDRDSLVEVLAEPVGERGRGGSLRIRRTLRLAMPPAFRTAWRWRSLK